MNKDYEMLRAELWKEIAVAYVTASNSTTARGAADWADYVLRDFDNRFKSRLTKQDEKEVH